MADRAFLDSLKQSWDMPARATPIVIIGAGMIVEDMHLPAYRKAGYEVRGVYDILPERSQILADRFDIPEVYRSLEEAMHTDGVVFDIAVPPDKLPEVIYAIPPKSVVLMQKPMGANLDDARRIRETCRRKNLIAAVNFQLRFSAMMLAFRDLYKRGTIGEIVDIAFYIDILNPWERFAYLKKQKRVEMMICSIHYFDWVRSVLGEPASVYAKSIPHPRYPDIEASRSSAILDYGPGTRCIFSLNDAYEFGPGYEDAICKVSGMRGAAVMRFGALIGYPDVKPDGLEFTDQNGEWVNVPLKGQWFPDAFIGTMSNLQRYASGEDEVLPTGVEDAYKTMCLVEALYQSSEAGGTPIPE